MDVRFIASFSVISAHPAEDRRLFVEGLGLPLQPPDSVADDGYVFSESIAGAKHFGVWPLAEAALACFGQQTWPDSHPVPQASIEFEVDDVEAAARELEGKGYSLVHPTRTEPWNQTIARLQTPDGLLIGVCFTPWLHDS
jgi:catechol 2,3-dioxygenase-like lactoylglutathione lyase family enzyme